MSKDYMYITFVTRYTYTVYRGTAKTYSVSGEQRPQRHHLFVSFVLLLCLTFERQYFLWQTLFETVFV